MDLLNDIDSYIDKLRTFKHEYINVQDLISGEKYLTSEDVANILGVSRTAACDYMNRPDFPKLKVGHGYRVSATAFFMYNLQARN